MAMLGEHEHLLGKSGGETMEVEDVKKIAVIGAGSMGHGIAEVVAIAGYEVNLRDVEQKIVDKARENIEKSLKRLEETGMISAGASDQAMKRLHKFVDLEKAVKEADFVIEAVPEKMDIKKDVFRALDEMTPEHAILATNTSSISVSKIAEVTNRPHKVVGTHFVNPPQRIDRFVGPEFSIMLPLVEVVKARRTAEKTVEVTEGLLKRMGKYPVVVKDTPAFIANRFIIRMGLEAAYALSEADVKEIDAALIYSELGLPMGVFELIDIIGLDVAVDILDYTGEVLGDAYKAPPGLRMFVEQGYLGQKSGKGFYDYSEGPPEIKKEDAKGFNHLRITAPLINEISKMIEEDLADAKKIDEMMQLSGLFTNGLSLADNIGLNVIAQKLKELKEKSAESWYEPTKLIKKLIREKRKFADLLK
jgi:enoyl-CoA hydratase/3-hydroxyacyl-CoA dehydrogenase